MLYVNCGCGGKYSIEKEWDNIDFNTNSHHVKKVNILKGLPYENDSVDFIFSSCMLEHFSREQANHFLKECFRCLKKDGVLRIVVPDLENVCREYLFQLEKIREADTKENELRYEYILIELLDQMTRKVSGGEMGKYWNREDRDKEYINQRTGIPEVEKNLTKKETFFVSAKSGLANAINKIFKNANWFQLMKQGHFQYSGEVHYWMYDSFGLGKIMKEVGFSDVETQKYNNSCLDNWKEYGLEVNDDGTEYKPNSLYVEARK